MEWSTWTAYEVIVGCMQLVVGDYSAPLRKPLLKSLAVLQTSPRFWILFRADTFTPRIRPRGLELSRSNNSRTAVKERLRSIKCNPKRAGLQLKPVVLRGI